MITDEMIERLTRWQKDMAQSRDEVAYMSDALVERLKESVTVAEPSPVAMYCGFRLIAHPVGTILFDSETMESFAIEAGTVVLARPGFQPLPRALTGEPT